MTRMLGKEGILVRSCIELHRASYRASYRASSSSSSSSSSSCTLLPRRGVVGLGADGCRVNPAANKIFIQRTGVNPLQTHCAPHRANLVSSRMKRPKGKTGVDLGCPQFRLQTAFYVSLLHFFSASPKRSEIFREERESFLDADPLELVDWSPTRMNHVYSANSRIIACYPVLMSTLLQIEKEKDVFSSKAKGFRLKLSDPRTVHMAFELGWADIG